MADMTRLRLSGVAAITLAVVALCWPNAGRAATLAEIKQSGKFDDWALVRQGRLSTMAVPEKFVAWLRARNPKVKI